MLWQSFLVHTSRLVPAVVNRNCMSLGMGGRVSLGTGFPPSDIIEKNLDILGPDCKEVEIAVDLTDWVRTLPS
jgi:hypothetical protein